MLQQAKWEKKTNFTEQEEMRDSLDECSWCERTTLDVADGLQKQNYMKWRMDEDGKDEKYRDDLNQHRLQRTQIREEVCKILDIEEIADR